MASRIDVQTDVHGSIFERLADDICRRAVSSPEAIAYEMTIAPALSRALLPHLRTRITGGMVLDVGCGGGRTAAATGQLPVTGLIGIDPSQSQIRSLTRRTRGNSAVWATRARVESLPFADDSFDHVFSSCAWKHWPDPRRGVAECARVTRPGGSLVIIEIDGLSTRPTFERFARETRFPPGLRKAYVRFAMRTVVGVAPNVRQLTQSFEGLNLSLSEVNGLGDSPFLLAEAIVY
jgi:ubiquinone/menaquinone biosynthesis C-methylase UbiE